MQQDYAQNIVIGFMRIEGRSIVVVANQPMFNAGVLDINASVKGARFVRFCDAFNIPLWVIEDVPVSCSKSTKNTAGLSDTGQTIVRLYEATVPKVTLITRKAYGGAYCVMNSSIFVQI